MENSKKHYQSLQYLRAISALGIVFFHLCRANGLTFTVGQAGVDVFFVISGFVMAVSTIGKPITFCQFFLRRMKRLVPAYWLATLATAAVIAAKPQFFYGTMLTPQNLVKSLFFIPYTNINGEYLPIVMQGWTLNMEMFFYLLVGACLTLSPKQQIKALAATITALVCLNPVLTLVPISSPMLLELLAGYTLGHFWLSRPYARNGKQYILQALLALAILEVSGYKGHTYRILCYGLPAFLLVLGSLKLEAADKLPKLPLAYLGKASYSLYLWHNLILIITGALLLHTSLPLPLNMMIETISAIGGSVVLYALIEKRINDIKLPQPPLPQPANVTL